MPLRHDATALRLVNAQSYRPERYQFQGSSGKSSGFGSGAYV